MIRAGIVGLGRWGQRLVTATSAEGGGTANTYIKYVRAVTRNPQKAREFCNLHNLPVSDDYQALLANPEVDAVVLATPHSQHVDQIKAAALAGKHIFVEKPVALEVFGAQEAINACKQAGVILAVGFNRRFLPAYQQIDRQLNAGVLGQALHIEGSFSGPFGFDYNADMWRGSRQENPAGGMAAMGIHVLDAMIHLMGPVESVQAISNRQVLNVDMDDTTSVLLRFQSRATGYISTLMATAQVFRLHLFGTKGWAQMRNHESLDIKNLSGEISTYNFDMINIERSEQEAFACLMTLLSFCAKQEPQISTFLSADLWWWLDRNTLGL